VFLPFLHIAQLHSQSVKHAVNIPAGREQLWHFTLIWNLAAKGPLAAIRPGRNWPPTPWLRSGRRAD